MYSKTIVNCRDLEAFLHQKNASLISQSNILGGNLKKYGTSMIVVGIGLTLLGSAIKNHK